MTALFHHFKGLRRLSRRHFWQESVLPALRRSRHVDRPGRFLVRELTRAHLIATYATSDGPVICLRHEGVDAFVFEEVLIDHVYEPPPEVAIRLDELSHPLRIIDLGANIGLFGAYAHQRWPHAEVIAYEADPANAAVHRRCMALNDAGGRWTLRECFAAAECGTQIFEADGSPLSRAVEDLAAGAAVETRSVDVLPELARAELAKIDIEGAEWPILLDPRLGCPGPAAIVLEFHSAGCPQADPAVAARDALARAGYRIEWHLDDGAPGLLWAVKEPAPTDQIPTPT